MMSVVPDLREIIPIPDEVIDAGKDGNLILFIGAGVSKLLGLPLWRDLASYVLDDLRQASLLNYSEIDQLKSTADPRQQLSIAKLIADENGIEIDISKHLSGVTEGNSIYKAINDIGCSCVTTNYDELLAPRYFKVSDGSQIAPAPNRVTLKGELYAHLLNEPGNVVHLHGCISKPETMVVTTKDYLEHYDHANVQEFLGELFENKVVVFLGYGLEESEILEHILRRGNVNQQGDRRRFLIQGYFLSQKPLYNKLHTYYEKSFGVHLLGFIRDHDDYRGLQKTVESWASELEIKGTALLTDIEFMNRVFDK